MSNRIRNLKIEHTPLSDLKPNARNLRIHSEKHIHQIARSLDTFGWTVPIITDGDGNVIAGNARLEAAKRLGLDFVPTIRVTDLTPEQVRAYIIADNHLAELSGWDDERLALELKELSDLELGFDLEVTGFETAEIDLRTESMSPSGTNEAADHLPEVDDASPPVTLPDDLWLLGNHRLMCGDATKPESYVCLMGEEKARMVFTDPPYNVAIDGHVCGLGAVKHREFAMASGEMSEGEFISFLRSVIEPLIAYSVSGAIHFICMDWRHIYELLEAGRGLYHELKNLCVWNKTNAGMGSLYRSQHELVVVFKAGSRSHLNNINLGMHGRYRTNVWDYAGANAFGATRDADLAMHPTVKPVALVKDAILDCSRRGDIVLDPFLGSGTTVIAAEKAGRRCFAMEIDPLYVDVAVRRWQAFTGVDAVRASDGRTFNEIAADRNAEAGR